MIPYEGKDPYIFVSYAHKDSDRVLPLLEGLSARGYRVWYDAGIEAGTEWPDYIAEHLENAAAVLAFLSESSLASVNCRQEIMYALDLSKPTLTAYLEDVTLTGGMRMRLGLVQAIFRTRHTTDDGFLAELCRASLLAPCKGEAPKAAVPERGEDAAASKPPCVTEEKELPMPVSTAKFEIRGRELIRYRGEGGAVSLPLGVDTVGSEAFKNSAVTEIRLPYGVKTLRGWCFACCKNLTSVALPEGIELVPSNAFVGCESLQSISLPATVKVIGRNAFLDCTALRQVAFPEGLTEIAAEAFKGCLSLTEATFPKSLELVNEGAFAGCKRLKKVSIFTHTDYTAVGKKSFPTTTKIQYL